MGCPPMGPPPSAGTSRRGSATSARISRTVRACPGRASRRAGSRLAALARAGTPRARAGPRHPRAASRAARSRSAGRCRTARARGRACGDPPCRPPWPGGRRAHCGEHKGPGTLAPGLVTLRQQSARRDWLRRRRPHSMLHARHRSSRPRACASGFPAPRGEDFRHWDFRHWDFRHRGLSAQGTFGTGDFRLWGSDVARAAL